MIYDKIRTIVVYVVYVVVKYSKTSQGTAKMRSIIRKS